MNKSICILGTRGIPASHGGFETFAEKLAIYLVDKGWDVTVYCQVDKKSEAGTDCWNKVNRVKISPRLKGALATIEFDLLATLHAIRNQKVHLVLGYNTAIFSILQRISFCKVAMNMDGIEWKRSKWGPVAKTWFYLNEVIGSNLSNVAICDHPKISEHIEKRCLKKTVMIPYGGDIVSHCNIDHLERYNLKENSYFISIARIEPENSILEIVKAARSLPEDVDLVVLGKLDTSNPYHVEVKNAASSNVKFLGAIYEKEIVSSLRFGALAYLHGHQVGGTNPSLVEALAASNPVIAHDNHFNRWTAGKGQTYFGTETECSQRMIEIIDNPKLKENRSISAYSHFRENFLWDEILLKYENVLAKIQ